MSRNLRYWSRFALQNLATALIFVAFGLVLAVGGAETMEAGTFQFLSVMALFGSLFSLIAFGCGVTVLYLPLLVSMGETRRATFLGYHYYMALVLVMGTGLWALLSAATGIPDWWNALSTVVALHLLVAAFSGLVGVLYARFKWVGILMIALLSGGVAGVASYTMVRTILREGTFVLNLSLSLSGWMLLGGLALMAVEAAVCWIHFRKISVKL